MLTWYGASSLEILLMPPATPLDLSDEVEPARNNEVEVQDSATGTWWAGRILRQDRTAVYVRPFRPEWGKEVAIPHAEWLTRTRQHKWLRDFDKDLNQRINSALADFLVSTIGPFVAVGAIAVAGQVARRRREAAARA